MPEEPKHPVEDLLEAHALQRRAEGGSFDLHPATHELLRGEALRTHAPRASAPAPNPESESLPDTRSAWHLLWIRLVGAFAVVGVLGIAVVVVQQFAPSPNMELAQTRSGLAPKAASEREELTRTQPAATPLLADSAADASQAALSKPLPEPQSEAASATLAQADLRRSDSPAPMPAIRGSRTLDEATDPASSNLSGRSLASREVPVPAEAKAKPVAAPATQSVAPASASPVSGAVFQRVERTDGLRRNMQSPALPGVLSTFTVSLLGNRLRLEENDGSVYLGDLAADGATFSVAGTSQTSGLLVRFTGQATLAGPQNRPGGPFPVALDGTVALGDRQQWRLRAEAKP